MTQRKFFAGEKKRCTLLRYGIATNEGMWVPDNADQLWGMKRLKSKAYPQIISVAKDHVNN